MKRILYLKLITLSFVFISASPPSPPTGGNGNGPGCPPLSPCWCSQHPNPPAQCNNIQVPVDTYILFPLIGGLLLGVFCLYKQKKVT